MLDRILDAIAKIMLVIAAVIGFCLSFIVVADVVGRVVFNSPLQGTPEIISSAIVIICWLQAAYAIRSGGMINVDAFTIHLPYRIQAALAVFGALLGSALFALICYGSIEQAQFAWESGEYDGEGALRVPAWPARFTLLVGAGLASVCYLLLAVKQVRAFLAGTPPVEMSTSH
jgi:TRAP-type C4-dicarboxylate transport system permease small subunit